MPKSTYERVRDTMLGSSTPLRNADVARKLGMSQQTTHPHFRQVMEELRAGSIRATPPGPAETLPAVPDSAPNGTGVPGAISGEATVHWELVIRLGGKRYGLHELDN